MDFFDVINTRKTIRKYKVDHPPIEDIKRIIDSGRLAPSATNSQNWNFVVIINDQIKQQMLQAVENTFAEIASWPESIGYENKITFSKNYSTFFVNAPVVIAIVETSKVSYIKEIYKKKKYTEEQIKEVWADSSLLSMGAAIENMSLAAHSLGYGSCWMCAPLAAAKKFKSILDLDEDQRVVSLLTLGTPLNDSYVSPTKKTLDEVMKIIE